MSKSETVNILCGAVEPAAAAPALPPFDERVLRFLADLSAALLRDREAKGYPDVVTFAFFCRRAHLEQLRAQYAAGAGMRLGRGMVFHIAPSNVPINFAYSLVSALLAGNASVVKASSRDFAQTRIVCRAMREQLTGVHAEMAAYVCVLTYERERQDVTEWLSTLCDARVIWGGDETVRRVREAPLSPLAFDVTFGDRYSLLCIRTGAVTAMEDDALAKVAQGFYNDTFLTDQNACTAPRLVYWLAEGDEAQTRHAQERFWMAVHAYAAPRYPVEAVAAVDKLTALYRAAATLTGAERVPMPDNLIARIRVRELTPECEELRCAGGLFVEYESTTMDALAAVVRRKYQTVSCLGVEPEQLRELVMARGLKGIDRIVPVGQTMDFSLVWDGYDLIETLSRRIPAM